MKVIQKTVVVALCLGCAALFSSCPESPPREPAPAAREVVTRMVSTLAEQRWVEPRLSAGSTYGRPVDHCDPDRSLCEPSFSKAGELESGRHNLADLVSSWLAAAPKGSAEKHAQALLALVQSDGASSQRRAAVEKAVQMMEELAQAHPSDVRIHSDLTATFYARAQRFRRPADLVRALEAAEEAVALDPRWPEARFNRALVQQALALPTARQSWQRYIELDPASPWAKEARQRHRALDVPEQNWSDVKTQLGEAVRREDVTLVHKLVTSWRRPARRYVEEELLKAWAEAFVSGDEGRADRALAAARMIADALAELNGNAILAGAVDVIEAAPRDHRRQLAEGHQAYAEGLRRRIVFEPFERARRKLAGSPFQSWAIVGFATCHYYRREHRQALELLEALRQEIGSDPEARRRNASLLGHISWMTALSKIFLTRPLEALGDYREALIHFEATGEREVINVHSRWAGLLASLGEQEEAWQHRYQALRGRGALLHARDKVFLLNGISEAAIGLGLTRSARLLEEEALELARDAQQKTLLVAALLHHAEINLRAGDIGRVLQDLEEVVELLEGEPELWEVVNEGIVSAWMLEIESDVRRTDDPIRSAALLTEALQRRSGDTYLPDQGRLLLKRARAFREAGELDRASADVETSVTVLEEEWRQILAGRRRGEHEQVWPSYFFHRRETFDLMIELLMEQGEPERAFHFAERARARELLDLVGGLPAGPGRDEPFRPRTEAAVREALPPGTVVVEYALLDDRLLIWEIRREATRWHDRAVSRDRIDELVEIIDRAFNQRDTAADFSKALARLHQILVQPLRAALKENERIVFVPDGSLHGVPFAALYDSARGRFLVEDHVLSVAPSATLYLFSLQRDRELQRSETKTALLIGDPAFDRELFPTLDDLPGAVVEIRRIAAEYPVSLSLEGAEATKPRLFSELGGYDVVHFAGHAIPNLLAPHRSSLVVAPSAEEPGILYAEELLRQDLGRTRLVVLSACSTAGGKAIGSLTVTGLVRPLLGAGVPAVVGTLWDVKSGATPLMLASFHRHLSVEKSVAGALRAAQLEMIEGNLAERSVKSWAPFQVIGAASFHTL